MVCASLQGADAFLQLEREVCNVRDLGIVRGEWGADRITRHFTE
jgi:hypothetical protein